MQKPAPSYRHSIWFKFTCLRRNYVIPFFLVLLWQLSACAVLSEPTGAPVTSEPAIAKSDDEVASAVETEATLDQSSEVQTVAVLSEEIINADPMTAFCGGDLTVFRLLPRDRARLHSICTAWYPGSSVPPLHYLMDGSPSNWKTACAQAWDSPKTERNFLYTALSVSSAKDRTYPLCYYAILDWDGDGVRDYQVTHSGRFVENDIDLDQDGVPNVRDSDPLNPEAGQEVSCGSTALPEHLRFSCVNGTSRACQLQQKLYDEFDVVVVNRDFEGTPELIEKNLQTIYDAASIVFAQGFKAHPGARRGDCNGLYTMQTVAFEQCPVIRKKPWDPSDTSCKAETYIDTEASAMAHNGLFTVFPKGANLPRVIQLGTYVHELAHLWQFAYDVQSDTDTAELISDNLWLVPEFEKVLKPFNWTFPKKEDKALQAQLDRYTKVLPREDELTTFDDDNLTLEGSPLSVHLSAAEYEGLVLSDWAKKHGNFSAYSLGNPWEWHADLFIAYLFVSLEEHIKRHTDSVPVSGEFISWFRTQVLHNYNNQFYHPNLKATLYTHFQQILPMDEAGLDELVCRYLVNDSFVFSKLKHHSILPFAPKTPPEHVALEIREQWQDRCAVQQSTDV